MRLIFSFEADLARVLWMGKLSSSCLVTLPKQGGLAGATLSIMLKVTV